MKKITKLFLTLALIETAFFAWAVTAIAADPLNLTSKMSVVGPAAGYGGERTLPQIVGGIIQSFLLLLGVIFLAYTVYAGYLWMTARGNEEQLTKAKAVIRGSIIGIIIVMGAYAITAFVVNQVVTTTGYTK